MKTLPKTLYVRIDGEDPSYLISDEKLDTIVPESESVLVGVYTLVEKGKVGRVLKGLDQVTKRWELSGDKEN